MTGYFHDVGAFHGKFELPVSRAAGGTQGLAQLDTEAFQYRLRFLQEELIEFVTAHQAGNLAGALDALVDLVWVALGTAHFMGAPFDEAWRLVVAANMAKVQADEGDTAHKRGAAERIRKPPGWMPPDIDGLLRHYTRYLGETT